MYSNDNQALQPARDLIIAIPAKERPMKAFKAAVVPAGFSTVPPLSRRTEGALHDETGALPDVGARFIRCSDAMERMRLGGIDVAIIGRDVVAEFNAKAVRNGQPVAGVVAATLPQSACKLTIAVPEESNITCPQDLAGLRIVTSYPATLATWLEENGVDNATIIEAEGGVESYVADGLADVACDVVESGNTLRAHNLRPTQMVLVDSTAVIVRATRDLGAKNEKLLEALVTRLQKPALRNAAREKRSAGSMLATV
ncbi:MAG: ATP phosphoribosyltransferase [Alphaproteobacteria bacterium]|nr:ATP phosphoribosyltransferase [Alphaproteobacteria bacterium]